VNDPDVIRAIEIMEARIESVASISDIARSVEVSKRTLERKFRQTLGRTPSQAHLECRLEHARRLLRNTDLPIRELALASGFSSVSYFCRSYKQHFRRQPGSDRHLDYSLVGPRRRFPPMPRRPTAREPPSPGSGIGLRRHRPGANEQTPLLRVGLCRVS
jgi:AraC-like DNA-binding protein